MRELKIKAYAKINLTLDVLGKRADGYHELSTIMQTIDLTDTITLREREAGITLISSSPDIPIDKGNIAYQAAELFLSEQNLFRGVEITIQKNIPIMAGLAGGSADAAAVLRGLKELWDLEIAEEKLWEMANQLGSDVAFCLKGGTCLGTGRGEILTPLTSAPPLWLVVAKPKLSVSTAEVYGNLNLRSIKKRPNNVAMIKALEEGNPEVISQQLCNVLETVTLRMHPTLVKMKDKIKEMGALGVLMSGSGPTLFAFTSTLAEGQFIAKALQDEMEAVFVTTTLGSIGIK